MDEPGVRDIGIEECRPSAQLFDAGEFQLIARRKVGSPYIPKRLFAYHLLTIDLHPLLTLLGDPLLPAYAVCRLKFGVSFYDCTQHIEVVYLAQRILEIT